MAQKVLDHKSSLLVELRNNTFTCTLNEWCVFEWSLESKLGKLVEIAQQLVLVVMCGQLNTGNSIL